MNHIILYNTLFFMSTILFIFYYKNILLNLMSMEFMIINILMLMFYTFTFLNMNIYLIALILCLCLCEGIMGLSIMVYMVRMTGNDFTNLIKLINW